jgi:hypothetical protein
MDWPVQLILSGISELMPFARKDRQLRRRLRFMYLSQLTARDHSAFLDEATAIMPRRLMPLPTTPPEYREWLSSLKDEIHQARRRAALAVNSEMILLYWRIGREIVQRQAVHKWGARVIDQLATDLHSEFPDVRGFSPRNLK